MAETYNPLDHSIVQAAVGSWLSYECDEFIEALLDALLEEVRRVHWNVFQHEWGPTWHADEVEDPEIPGIAFVRFYADRCDCGGQEAVHQPGCEWLLKHGDWIRRRLHALYDPDPDPNSFGRLLDFSPEREAAFRASDPPPPCTCGGADGWEEHGCAPTCIGQRPNFQHEDVQFSWYKRPGRGMSTNKDWSADEWRSWFGRCLVTIRAFDTQMSDEDHERCERLRVDLKRRFPTCVT